VTTRRAFIGTLAGGLLAAPHAAEAQRAVRTYRIGVFHKEMVPGLRRVRVLVDPHDPATPSQLTEITALLIRLASEKPVPLPSYRKESVQQGTRSSYAPDIAAAGWMPRFSA